MKALKTLFILSIFFNTIFLYAENEILTRSLEHRLEKLETHRDKPLSQITPCAGPIVKNGMDIAIYGDFIYWTGRLDTLAYAQTGYGNFIEGKNPHKGQVKSVNWKRNKGFKTGLGWGFDHGCWDMTLQYTWFYTSAHNQTQYKTQSNSLQPLFSVLYPNNFHILSFKNARAHFDLHYQVGDIELGRNYYVSHTLKMRPFIGLKGTWQKQDYKVFYNTIARNTYDANNVDNTSYNYKAQFNHAVWGGGIRAGLKTSWQFNKSISLFGDLSISEIWLHYNTERADTFTTIVYLDYTLPKPELAKKKSPDIVTVNIQDTPNLVKPVIELAFGIRAETYFNADRYHILCQVGWESQIWINQTLYINTNNNFDRYDLSLQGITAKLRFEF